MTELVHFYSYATGVSLELPVGFEAVGRDAASASYAVLGDDDVTVVPGTQLQVRVVATLGSASDDERAAQVDALAGALAEHGGDLVDRGVRVVDDERVVTVTTRTDDGMLALASATSTAQRLLSIVALARDEETLAAFDSALDSVRFVEL